MNSFISELDKIPNIDEYKFNLESLKKIDFRNMTQKAIGDIIIKKTIIIPYIPVTFTENSFNNDTFYRVRKNINLVNEDITQITTFSYPEPNFCTQNKRANLKGKCVFYCSEVAATSIFECEPNDKEIMYLSVWQPDVKRDVKAISFCKKVWQTMDGIAEEIEFLKTLDFQISELGTDKSEQLNYLNNFIAEYFIEDKEPYYITSWVSDNILYGKRNIDCIHYQSNETNEGSNFAFHPSFINDGNLKLEKVVKMEVQIREDRFLDYHIIEIGYNDCGKIEWRALKESEKTLFHSIIKMGDSDFL